MRLIAGGLVMLVVVTSTQRPAAYGAEIEGTPAAYFDARLEETANQTRTFDDIPSNLEMIENDFGKDGASRTFLPVGRPTRAVDLTRWSNRPRGGGVLPLYWDPQRRQFEVVREQLRVAPESVVRFTYYFLRAYDGLAPDLRQTGSTLAVGVAALVASEALYRQNWACLPIDVEPAAAVVNVLALYQPDLLQACYANDSGRRKQLVEKAVRAMNSPTEPSWLYERPASSAVKGLPVLVSFIPREPAAVKELIRNVRGEHGIRNLTLRAAVIAAACPVNAEAEAWKGHLDALLADLNEEMKLRDSEHEPAQRVPGPVAPAFDHRSPRVIVGDPAIVRHLMAMATRIEASRLGQLKQPTPEEYLQALKSGPATRSVIEICGSDPFVEFGPVARGDTSAGRTGKLTWGGLMRIQSGVERRAESIVVDLVKPIPRRAVTPKPAEAGPGAPGLKITQAKPQGPPGGGGSRGDGGGGARGGGGRDGGGGKSDGGGGRGAESGGNGPSGRGQGPVSAGPGEKALVPALARRSKDRNDGLILSPPRPEHHDPRRESAPKAPVIVPPPRVLIDDRIEFTGPARELLLPRGDRWLATFRGEHPSAAPAGSPVIAFWRRTLGHPGDLMPGQAGASRWPFEDSGAMRTWLEEVVRQRKHFLTEQTNTAYLSRVCMLEVLTASWLWEMGAKRTADLVLSDLIDLSVSAGCEPTSVGMQASRLGPDLELPVLLGVPGFVRGTRRGRLEDVYARDLSEHTLRWIDDWVKRRQWDARIVDQETGSVSLTGLYAYWAEADGERPVVWRDIPRPGTDVVDGHAFVTWLGRMKDRLRRESVPPTSPAVLDAGAGN